MSERKKKIRRKPGQVFQVPLGNGKYAYGQTTKYYSIFFDYQNDGKNPDINEIIQKPILFKIGVAYYVIEDKIWPVLGILPINPEFEKEEDLFTYNTDKQHYVIWKTATHKILASPEEIYNLEYFSSWEHGSVSDRLRDHFAGRPCYWVEEARNSHNPNFERDIVKFYQQYGYEHPYFKDDGSEK